MRIKLTIQYDGTDFAGWQRQDNGPTVQAAIEDALAEMVGKKTIVRGAGRTDAGVHALGQVASYEGAPPRLEGVNALLPSEIALLGAEPAADGFDARRDARSRTYCYRVLARRAPDPFERGRALHWPHPVDRDALDACAAAVAGEHDFTAFTPTETDHVRFRRAVVAAREAIPRYVL